MRGVLGSKPMPFCYKCRRIGRQRAQNSSQCRLATPVFPIYKRERREGRLRRQGGIIELTDVSQELNTFNHLIALNIQCKNTRVSSFCGCSYKCCPLMFADECGTLYPANFLPMPSIMAKLISQNQGREYPRFADPSHSDFPFAIVIEIVDSLHPHRSNSL